MSLSMTPYLTQMNKKFNYRATWLPQRRLTVGNFGLISDGQWNELGSLASGFNIKVESSAVDNAGEMELTSATGVSITTKLSGQPSTALEGLLEGDAGVSVKFATENAFVFKAKNLTYHTLANQFAIAKQIIELWELGQWKKEYMIISEVVEAESATILIAAGSNGQIELKAKGKIETGKIDIADASMEFEAVKTQNIGIKIIAESKITPLYKVVKLKTGFLDNPGLVARKSQDPKSMEDLFEIIPF